MEGRLGWIVEIRGMLGMRCINEVISKTFFFKSVERGVQVSIEPGRKKKNLAMCYIL